ncbi:hypothetical protein ABIF00_002837 [Bradyrhizobium elkanii]
MAIACAASRARSSRPPLECRRRAYLEIGDPGVGGVEPAAFLLVAGDRQRQGPLRAVDGGGGIAHLLVEDDQRCPVLQFLLRCCHAAAEKRQNSFEHLVTPCYEHRS